MDMQVSNMVEIDEWLRRRRRLLLLGHERPDGDSLGAQIGLHLALVGAGHECMSYFSDPHPARYESVFAPALQSMRTCFGDEYPAALQFDGILVLDTSNASRIDAPDALDLCASRPASMCVIDHHPDNERYGDVNWVAPTAAATAQMIADFANFSASLSLSPVAASALLAGVMTDCGGFRFRNTDAAVLRTAAELVDAGADAGALAEALFFNESHAKMRLRSRLIETVRFECNGRLAYATMTPALFDELGMDPSDTEDVIDVIRAVRGVQIACLLQQTERGAVRISLRSRSPRYDVSEIAHSLGGGGHRLAAGARFENATLDEAVKRLIVLAGKQFS